MRVNLVVNSADTEGPAFQFGPFRLIPARQLLLGGDARVRLGGRALEILTALVERPGQLVTKQELIVRTWPDTVVEDSNLKVHIAALRKALGEEAPDEQYFVTVTGRGYRFVAPVQSQAASAASAASSRTVTAEETRPGPRHNVPVTFVRPIGRSVEIEALRSQLGQTRFVTITGPGGVGKTTVALSLARALADDGQCDVWFADLAALSEESLVPGAVAVGLHEEAEALYLQAIELARQQGALSWELRAAMSLAQSRHRIGDTERAYDVLSSVYTRFSEGFETADLKAARALLGGFGEALTPQAGVAGSKNNESKTER